MDKDKICFLLKHEGHQNNKIFSDSCFEELGRKWQVVVWDGQMPVNEFCRDASVIVTTWGSPKVEASVLESAPELKFIFHAAGTVKSIVDAELMKRGVRVSSAANVLGRNVAITTFGLMLVAVKKIPWWNQHIKNTGGWRENKELLQCTNEIGTVNTGVISMSHVGKNLVSLLKNVTDNILVYDPYWKAEDIKNYGGIKADGLYEIAEKCEVVALCAPLLKSTEGMLDKKFFMKMKDGAVFVNASRGAILDEGALVEELKKERIFACLDVTNPEPPPADSPLRTLKNIMLAPHVAGIVNSGLQDMGRFCVEEVIRLLEGRELVNEVKPEKLNITA